LVHAHFKPILHETLFASLRVEEAVSEEVEADDFEPIEKLAQLGVNAGDIKKAKDAGYHTCSSLLMTTKKASPI
jgi:hypothetical protein